MKIEIVLKDPRYCDGCPFLWFSGGFPLDCINNFKIKNMDKDSDGKWLSIRPGECIEKYGD
jgi:hypothetical protein